MQRKLEALKARHEILEAKIRAEQIRPRPDEFQIMHLKRLKLRLREQIEEAAEDNENHAPRAA